MNNIQIGTYLMKEFKNPTLIEATEGMTVMKRFLT